jgi:hypothetical protein
MLKKSALCEFLWGKTGLCAHERLWILHHLIYIYISEDVKHLHSARIFYVHVTVHRDESLQ